MSKSPGLRRRRPSVPNQEKEEPIDVSKTKDHLILEQKQSNNNCRTRLDLVIVSILTILAICVRFYRLDKPEA